MAEQQHACSYSVCTVTQMQMHNYEHAGNRAMCASTDTHIHTRTCVYKKPNCPDTHISLPTHTQGQRFPPASLSPSSLSFFLIKQTNKPIWQRLLLKKCIHAKHHMQTPYINEETHTHTHEWRKTHTHTGSDITGLAWSTVDNRLHLAAPEKDRHSSYCSLVWFISGTNHTEQEAGTLFTNILYYPQIHLVKLDFGMWLNMYLILHHFVQISYRNSISSSVACALNSS